MPERPSDSAAQAAPPAPTERDRYTYGWLIVFGLYFLLFVYGNELDRILNLWLMLVPLLGLPAIVIAIYWLVALVINLARRYWRRLLSQLAAPFIAAAFFLVLRKAGVDPQTIRFAMNKHSYEAAIAGLPQAVGPRFHKFDWGSTGGAAVVNIFFTLIYDESDELGLASELRTIAWRRRMTTECPPCEFSGGDGSNATVKPMGGHFFLLTEAV